ncbi:MAG: sugar phosphate nucleotidyltransferase [Thermoplasmatales archaeon]
MVKINVAVIPAAGLNKRLADLNFTKILPKPMLPIIDKPILEYIIKFLVNNGVQRVYMIVNNKKKVIIDYFGSGEEFDTKIMYLEQGKPTGIADAINTAQEYINEPFFCVLGDTFVPNQRIDKLVNIFQVNNATAFEALSLEENAVNIKESCEVVMGDDHKISELVEKPDRVFGNIRGSGIYIFEPKIFELISNWSKRNENGEKGITEILNDLAKKGELYGGFLEKMDVNVNYSRDLIKASVHALSESGVDLERRNGWRT